jgi:predicted acetyltransferase
MRSVEPLRDEGDLPALAEMLSWSFDFPAAEAEPWLRRAGFENVRLLREDGRPIACLVLIPMGQHFGGKSVPMVGVAGVSTAADRRGSGAATTLMRGVVEDCSRARVPLSTLFPATRALYRGVGYEPAGSRFEYKVPLASIGVRDRALAVHPIGDDDDAEIEALYRAHAARHDGTLDRGPYVWGRVRAPRNERARGFAVGERGRFEGYVYLHERHAPPGETRYDLRVTDVVARTPAAAARLLALFADHRGLAANVAWHGGPADPLAQALPEVGYAVTMPMSHWMVRVTDAAAALASRGYPAGVETEVEIDVADPLLPDNHGKLVLAVAGGAGEVRRGGAGRVRVDVRGLAALYTGHASPWTLASLGLLEGPSEDLARLARAFTGPSPWMADFF